MPSLPLPLQSLLTPYTILLPILYLCYTLTRPKPTIPTLTGLIPRLSVTILYMTDMRTFLSRARAALCEKGIVQFYVGPAKAYLVSGASNIATMFRASGSVSSDIFILMVKQHIWNMTPNDLAKFKRDKTGRLPKPVPGTENHPEDQRYWAGMHAIMHRYLARTNETNVLARSFQRFFGERLDKLPLGEGVEVGVYEFLLDNMAGAAVTAINGQRICEMIPGLLDMIWTFDEIAASLVWGLPRWLNRKAYDKRDRLIDAAQRYLEEAIRTFDWEGEENPEWEPVFGSRFTREWVRYLKDRGFDLRSIAGGLSNTTLFGANANTTPVATWCVMEVAKDPKLLKEVRAEVETAYEIDPTTGKKVLRGDLLTALPLLQSIYIEGLRLHVSMNITREITGPIELSGGVVPQKGAILQAATEIVHLDENIWGAEGHPASEFWAERHIKYVEDGQGKQVRRFEMAAGPNDFFPYGGGVSVCPGRFFAKQDMMLVVAMLVSRFDIEFVRWTNRDGTPSDRPAQNDVRWSGGASVPPDREMKVILKRLW
ncbi:cytochrome P450 [Lasiosphaeris hirsuta]|uniref:Cytochrome P450 n=1 Tax=Lasiosphaeris hirsuta TaxID=260670 RepID=A0AA40E6M8_9PEZI|nr:cytochrome P450 [Lasiosphaeris hirsuta]